MRIEQNKDVQSNHIQNQDNVQVVKDAAKKTAKKEGRSSHKDGNLLSVSGANLKGESLIKQRQDFARKQALKVVSDAFGAEKKLDEEMQEIKDEIKRLQDVINEKKAEMKENNDKLKELQEEYGIDPESEENKNLTLLSFVASHKKEGLSDEEKDKMSEYQQRALGFVMLNDSISMEIKSYQDQQMGNVQGFADIKRAREKSQDMLKAQNAAEEIMEVANGETIALLTQETVEHVDKEQKEREEEAKEAAEKKKEEKKEEAKKLEKEALQQEMIENIKEHNEIRQQTSADAKRAVARRERAEAESMDAEEVQKTIISDSPSMEETQDAVNLEITNILNKLSLLSNDVKGSTVDSQI